MLTNNTFHNTMNRFTFLVALLLAASVAAFQPSSSVSSRTTITPLSSTIENWEPSKTSSVLDRPLAIDQRKMLRAQAMYLPRQHSDEVPSMELWAGRAAMIAAICLILNEAVTGQSLPEQFFDVFSGLR